MNLAIVACGAIASHVHDIAARRNWDLHIEPVNPLLHNRPEGIAPEVDELLGKLKNDFEKVVVAYADCGTYGELDKVCEKHSVNRLAGEHCYDVFATAEKMRREFETEPGTFVLTDYLVKSFRRSVMKELGLEKYPELRDDYFHSYRRILWLAQHQTPELLAAAHDVAQYLNLPLEIIQVGDQYLEEQLVELVGESM